MTEVPTTAWTHELDDADALAQAPLKLKWRRLPGVVEHGFTHFPLAAGGLCRARAGQDQSARRHALGRACRIARRGAAECDAQSHRVCGIGRAALDEGIDGNGKGPAPHGARAGGHNRGAAFRPRGLQGGAHLRHPRCRWTHGKFQIHPRRTGIQMHAGAGRLRAGAECVGQAGLAHCQPAELKNALEMAWAHAVPKKPLRR